MAQFVLDTSQLDVDVLGPIVYATASADLQGLTATATAEVTNVVTATANLGGPVPGTDWSYTLHPIVLKLLKGILSIV